MSNIVSHNTNEETTPIQQLEGTAEHPPRIIPNLIIIDGPSGTGKTTMGRLLSETFKRHGLTVALAEESDLDPNRAETATIAQTCTDPLEKDRILANIFARHRATHIYPQIDELCIRYDMVVILRGELSTAAYQTAREALSIEYVSKLHRAQHLPLPAAYIVLTNSPETSRRRIDADRVRNETDPRSLSGKVTGNEEHRAAIHRQFEHVTRTYREKYPECMTSLIDTERLSELEVLLRIINCARRSSRTEITRIRAVETQLQRELLFSRLRSTNLVGFPHRKPYEKAEITICTLQIADIAPSARYVLTSQLDILAAIQQELLQIEAEDLYSLEGIIQYDGGTIAPPIIELHDGRYVVIDGQHRIFNARSQGLPAIRCAVIETEYPSPVMPLDWSDVETTDTPPVHKRDYNPQLPVGTHSLYYRDLSQLGASGERIGKEFIQPQIEAQLIESAAPLLREARKNFDEAHTYAVVHYMKLLLRQHPNLDPTVMIAAAYLHDIGYTGMFNTSPSYAQTTDAKEDHMIRGAMLAGQILAEFSSGALTDQQKECIVDLVRRHDNVETVVNSESGLVMMEADTLGVFYMATTAPSFSPTELAQYLARNKERRVSRFQTPFAIHIAGELIKDIEAQLASVDS